jgi:hypothetical protein
MSTLQISFPIVQFHQPQGQTNDCAPFTVAIVINALTGENLSGARLAQEMNRVRLSPRGLPFPVIRRIPNWATFPWGIADELGRHGLRARWRLGASENDLLTALRENRVALPIVGSLAPLWAHVKILVAHEAARGWGFVDPAQPRAEVIWDSPQRFALLWGNWGHLLIETV